MFRHIVLFALDKDLFIGSEAQGLQLAKIKSLLEALPSKIEVLSDLKVYLNENPEEEYDFALEAWLPSAEDLPLYAQHPEHLLIVKEEIKPFLKKRACVDFNEI